MSTKKLSREQAPETTAPKGRGKASARNAPLMGNSHTEFTGAELERLADAVWQHGRVMPDADAAIWRQDACGAWMRRDHFGHEASEFGWKIEKVSAQGPGSTGLLRPFNQRNRFDIANGRPQCDIIADRSNISAEQHAGPPRNKPP